MNVRTQETFKQCQFMYSTQQSVGKHAASITPGRFASGNRAVSAEEPNAPDESRRMSTNYWEQGRQYRHSEHRSWLRCVEERLQFSLRRWECCCILNIAASCIAFTVSRHRTKSGVFLYVAEAMNDSAQFGPTRTTWHGNSGRKSNPEISILFFCLGNLILELFMDSACSKEGGIQPSVV